MIQIEISCSGGLAAGARIDTTPECRPGSRSARSTVKVTVSVSEIASPEVGLADSQTIESGMLTDQNRIPVPVFAMVAVCLLTILPMSRLVADTANSAPATGPRVVSLTVFDIADQFPDSSTALSAK